MTNADYRDMASEIRDLIPLLLHAQAVADLRLLADHYERVAHYLEMVPGALPDTLVEYRRQAG
ncbi:MAG: hypothetical protein ACLPTM_04430 [Steroidobacteraceae bacterium]